LEWRDIEVEEEGQSKKTKSLMETAKENVEGETAAAGFGFSFNFD